MSRILKLVMLLVFVVGCSQELVREKAAELIKQSPDFASYSWDVFVCSGVCGQRNQGPLQEYEENVRTAFKNADYIQYEKVGQERGGDHYRFELTDKGVAASKQWTTLPPISDQPANNWRRVEYRVSIARTNFIEVTGIQTTDEGKSAVADFQWKFFLSPIGEELKAAGLNLKFADEVRRGTAIFQLYDSGWRLTDVAVNKRR